MIGSRTLTLLCLLPLAVGATERPPLRDGEHAFRHRSAEHPNLPAHPLVARVTGTRMVLGNRKPSSVFPIGVVTDREMIWHGLSKWCVCMPNDVGFRVQSALEMEAVKSCSLESTSHVTYYVDASG